MNLWLSWALVVGLLLSAALGTLASRRGSRSRILLVPWFVAAVATATVAYLTWDELEVSDAELDDAVTEVADRLDGASYVLPALELRRQVGVELGHPVDLVSTGDAEPDTAERQQTAYDVTPRADDDGPAMCLTVVTTGDAGGQRMDVSADPGRCGATS